MRDTEIRAATDADFVSLYGMASPWPVRAVTGTHGGEIVVIAGVADMRGQPVMFGDVAPGMRRFKPTIVRVALAAARYCTPGTLAWSDPSEPASVKLLEIIGMRFLRPANPGAVYVFEG